jgi:hypothetical protein
VKSEVKRSRMMETKWNEVKQKGRSGRSEIRRDEVKRSRMMETKWNEVKQKGRSGTK